MHDKDRVLHDILLTFITSCLNGFFDIVLFLFSFIFTRIYDGVSRVYTAIFGNYIKSFISIIIHIFIIPIVESIYPISDIEKKFDMILKLYNTSNDPNPDVELTQDVWNSYIHY